ncbi:HAD-IC family P-type ATPase, partial [Pseudogemmobacter faecipullorum]
RGGVLFKGGAALEALAEVKSFSFDKTGTLTTGVAEVTDLTSEIPEGRMLALLSGLEAQSEHPIAAAIRRRAEAEGLAPAAIRDVVTHPSEGITGIDEEGPIWAGNQRMLERMGARADTAGAQRLKASAQTVTWIGRGAQLIGGVTVADRPRPSSAGGLSQLRAAGVAQLALMTGDRRPVAERIGRELGFSNAEIHAELLPEDKVKLVAALAEKGRTAFVGDGVNDAAALARADVGVAMGVAGSEVALQAADVALLSEDMTRLAAARTLALRTRRIIRQNLGFALAMMVLLVVSALFFELPLPLAVIGHEGGTVLVVLNGLRLLADPIRNDRGAARKAASHPSSQPQEVSHV